MKNKLGKKEYLIIGDNNFWYASGLKSKKEVASELKNIQETVYHLEKERPNQLYVYEAREVLNLSKEIKIKSIKIK